MCARGDLRPLDEWAGVVASSTTLLPSLPVRYARPMPHRDPLVAARARIEALEAQLAEAQRVIADLRGQLVAANVERDALATRAAHDREIAGVTLESERSAGAVREMMLEQLTRMIDQLRAELEQRRAGR